MLTHEATITASLNNYDTRDAHRLYEAALAVVALPCLFSPAVLRAVSDKLAEEAERRTNEQHEREALIAIAYFLTMEACSR